MLFAITAHILAAIIWVGGMFFAYVCLRPSLPGILKPPQPAQLWQAVLGRFFSWVWGAIIVLFTTGLWMGTTRYGGFLEWPHWLLTMFCLAITMSVLFMHVFYAPFKRLQQALNSNNLAMAVRSIGQIRRLVGVNLCLGLVVAVVGAAGRYL
ncbi:MAG TPA: hypothetical protein DGR97_01190 [Gammaproteobacteria bacterium]|nr:hypothetical protein [Gammaproteobacteria bacterium]